MAATIVRLTAAEVAAMETGDLGCLVPPCGPRGPELAPGTLVMVIHELAVRADQGDEMAIMYFED